MKKKAKTREEKILNCFNVDADGRVDDLVFWSFRYFLGRMTISAVYFAEDLAAAWEHLNDRTKSMIRRELEAAFQRDDDMREIRKRMSNPTLTSLPLGMDFDRAAWELVRKAYKKEAGK